ncbi:hypothetical protein [Clostridium perfringens]|uniref:hypothetical protein n=1 Tax=Clostridium perfringens TaxID=1502 RepID=UPI002366F623|nr:hypothetical protein [Clostridium perfringens]
MASIFFYTKSPETSIFDLEYFNESKLDLEKIKGVIEKNVATYDDNKIFNKEGYTNTVLDENKGILSSIFIFKNNLGQYTTVTYDEKNKGIKVSRAPYSYFGQARIVITDELNIMFRATYSSEESAKTKSISFFEDIGIDLEPIKLDNNIFQYIRNNYDWKKIKIQRIEREKDSTRSLSYEIDPASDKESEVDKIYNDSGLFEHITFNLKFKDDIYIVKLYKQGNKITVDDGQFESKSLFDEFCLYLLEKIIEIKNVCAIGSEEVIEE